MINPETSLAQYLIIPEIENHWTMVLSYHRHLQNSPEVCIGLHRCWKNDAKPFPPGVWGILIYETGGIYLFMWKMHQHHQHFTNTSPTSPTSSHHPTQNHPNITLSFKVPQETIKTAAKTIVWTMFILVM